MHGVFRKTIGTIFSVSVIASILASMVLGLASCGGEGKVHRYEAEFIKLFDTITRIVAYTDSKEEFTRYSQLIYDNLNEYHQLFDIYNEYEGINNIKTINDSAGKAPVKVDRRIIDLILFAKSCYVKTEGEMNIAFGSVLKIWHDYRTAGVEDPDNARLPPEDKLKEAAKHTDINKIIVNEKESTVYLEDPHMSLDVGAIGKGYAAEQVSRIAAENGFVSGLISVGGNICAIGKKQNSKPWNVGIQNPDTDSREANIEVVYLIDKSLVTSGVYERYYTVDGINYHHIIDPDTLYPARNFKSVTIICDDSGLADAMSTAVFNMPFRHGYEYVEGLPGVEAFWVMDDGEIKYSSNFVSFKNINNIIY